MGTAEKIVMIMGQRSRSCSNDHGNLVNSISGERLKGFGSIQNLLSYYTWETKWVGFSGRGVNDQGYTCTNV